MAQVEAVWEGKEPGFVDGRYGTPNHAMLETMVGIEAVEDLIDDLTGAIEN